MPVTCGCFLITALSISGFPPFNGFFSKEIIYDAAKDAGLIFYVAALVGTFFTAISFLKLGHCVYFGKSDDAHVNIKEAPLAMLLPMILITLACICLGPLHNLALNKLILPVFQNQALSCWKFALNLKLLTLSMLVFLIAFLSHFLGTKIKGSPLKAVDYIHHAPILSRIYTKAEQGRLDPYNIGLSLVDCLAHACTWCDRKIDWLYDGLLVGLGYNLSQRIRRIENGSYSTYIIWCLAGLVLVTVYLMYSLY
jgi:NADH:ubiquinone oxidoreductase subunit 5 (subunit L)/multisubunit Na+/H+ antiporter MnhA subunit